MPINDGKKKKIASFAFCFAIPKQMIHHIADGMKERNLSF